VLEIEVDIEHLYWPPKCAYCNAPATNTVTARCSAVKSVGYDVIVWTTTTREIAVNYPVCSTHRLKATVASILSARSMFYLAVGGMSVFGLLGAAADDDVVQDPDLD
jgi:hypothetical protein